MKHLLTGALLLTVAWASADTPANLRRVVLPNGLTVLAVEDRGSAVAGLHLAARYDPAGIPPARAGLAALSQQLLQIQLTAMLHEDAWQELSRQLHGTRAGVAANTEADYCEIRGKITDGVLPQALQVAGKLLLGHPQVTAEQLQAAREILIEDLRDDSNTVIQETYYCFLRALLGRRSPLARSVQGSEASLQALTADDVAVFRATYMVPNNAVLTIIGPRSPRDLADLAKLAVGQYPAGKTAVPAQTAAATSHSRLCVAQQNGWRGVSLMAGVPAPAAHAFRRFFALQALRSGLDVLSLQKMLGHADLSVINRYVKQSQDDLKQRHDEHSPVDRLLG